MDIRLKFRAGVVCVHTNDPEKFAPQGCEKPALHFGEVPYLVGTLRQNEERLLGQIGGFRFAFGQRPGETIERGIETANDCLEIKIASHAAPSVAKPLVRIPTTCSSPGRSKLFRRICWNGALSPKDGNAVFVTFIFSDDAKGFTAQFGI